MERTVDKHASGSLIGILDRYGAWGNLNQDWLEFCCEIETLWDWCVLLPLNEQERDHCYELLAEGKLIMQIHYLEENNVGETNYIEHHTAYLLRYAEKTKSGI